MVATLRRGGAGVRESGHPVHRRGEASRRRPVRFILRQSGAVSGPCHPGGRRCLRV